MRGNERTVPGDTWARTMRPYQDHSNSALFTCDDDLYSALIDYCFYDLIQLFCFDLISLAPVSRRTFIHWRCDLQ